MRTNKEQWFKLLEEGNLTKISDFLKKHPKSVDLVEDSESKHTCVFYAVQHDDQSIGDRLLKIFLLKGAKTDKRDNIEQTAMFYAARFAHIKQIDLLVKFGCDTNLKDTYGQTALYYAARDGQVVSINRLIHHGADVNSIDNLNQTALFYTCREGKCEAAKALIKAGADINLVDKSRNTPLSWARRSHDLELIDYLLSLGASDRPPKRKRKKPGTGIRGRQSLCACCSKSCMVTYRSAASCVLSSTTWGATPASSASFQRSAHRHHRSPGFRPGKRYSIRGVMRSLPWSREKSRNAAVTMAHTTCRPASSGPVAQHPSR